MHSPTLALGKDAPSSATPSRTARLALKAALSGALLVFVVSRAQVADVRLPGGVAILGGMGAAVLLFAGALVMSAVRWWLVLGPGLVPLGSLVRLYFVGQFFSLFLPTSVGGDAVRILALSRGGTATGRAVSSVLIERLLGVGALLTYLVLGGLMTPALFSSPMKQLSWAAGWRGVLTLVIVGGLAVGLFLALARRWLPLQRLLHDARSVWARFCLSPLPFAAAVLVSLVVQATYVLVWYVLAVILHLAVPLRALLVFVPFVSLASMLPVTISGLGVREGAWTLLLAPLGISSASAIGFSLLFYLANLITGVLGGGVYMTRGADVGRAGSRLA